MPTNPSAPTEVSKDFLPLIAALMSLVALAIDLPLPAFPQMRQAFGLPADSVLVGQTIAFFFFGMAVPQLLYGPMTDRYGRKPVLYLGLGIYMLGAVGSALAPSLQVLLLSRLIWGAGAAAIRVVVVAMVRDRFSGAKMARFMSFVFALFVLVPVVAPTLGSALLQIMPWQGLYWVCLVVALGAAFWAHHRLVETLPVERRRPLRVKPVLRASLEVVQSPITVVYCLVATGLFGVFMSYLSSSELLVRDVFGRGEQFPLVFGGVSMSAGAGALLNGRLVVRYGLMQVVRWAGVGFLVSTAALAGVAFMYAGHPPFWYWYPVLALAIVNYMVLFSNFNTISLGPMAAIAGTASAVTGAFNNAAAAFLAGLLDQTYDGGVLPLSCGWMAAGLLVGMVLLWSRPEHAVGDEDLPVTPPRTVGSTSAT